MRTIRRILPVGLALAFFPGTCSQIEGLITSTQYGQPFQDQFLPKSLSPLMEEVGPPPPPPDDVVDTPGGSRGTT
jgi:hypothetical protein